MKTVEVRVKVKHYDAALAACNEIREANGKKPVTKIKDGVQSDNRYCPIGRTIDKDGVIQWNIDATSKQAKAFERIIEAVDNVDEDGEFKVRVVRGLK